MQKEKKSNKVVAVHFSPGAASRAHSVEVSSAVEVETNRFG